MQKGHIFFISGIAGAGKWTAINAILEENIPNLQLVLSCKTRAPRSSETLGVDYYRLSSEEFQKGIERWDFLEYNFVHGQDYYGTRYIDVIDNGINKGKNILKEMDITILPTLLKQKPELRKDFTYIFLDIPNSIIKQRMADRWDDVTWKDFEARMNSADKERALIDLADYVIDATQSKEQVFEEIKNLILKK